MKLPILLSATASLLLGAFVLSRHHPPSTTTDAPFSAPARTKREHSNITLATEPLLAQLTRWRDGTADLDRETIHALADKLLQLDTDAAARFAESIPLGPHRDEALRRFAQGLATRAPERAEHWAVTLSDEAERTAALAYICTQIARTDAAGAIHKAEHHQLDQASSITVENLVHQWADQDLPAATAWTLARPHGQQREQMCSRLAIVQSATEPEQAARLVLEEIPEGPNQTEALISVISQWATRDPQSATIWVESFPSGSLKERAENELQQLGKLR